MYDNQASRKMASKGSSDAVASAAASDDHEEKEVKKRRFHPLRAMRRLFTMRRKTKTFSSGTEDSGVSLVSASSRPAVTRRDAGRGLGSNAKLPSKHFSMSADSVFTPSAVVSESQGLHETAASIPDLHLGQSKLHSKSKTMSRESEHSLYSMDSSELEEEFFSSSPTSGSFFRSASSLDSSMELDLDAVSPSESLDLTAAKHKSAVRPKQRRKPSKHSQSLKSPKSPPANLTSVSEESPSKMSFSGSRRESEEKKEADKENVEKQRANSLDTLPSKDEKKEDMEVAAINSNQETKVVMRQKRLGSSSPVEKDKEHQSILLEMKRKSFNKSLESVTDKELKPRTPSPEQASEFSKAFDKFKRRSVYTDDKGQEASDSSTNKDGAVGERKAETKAEPKSPGGKIGSVNISMFEKSQSGNPNSADSKPKNEVKKRDESPTKGSQPWRSKTAPVDPVAFKVAQSKSSDALSVDKQPLKRISSQEPKQSGVKVETKRFSAIESGSGGGEPAWISLARKKQKDPVEEKANETKTSTLSASPPKSPVPKSPVAKSPIFEKSPETSKDSEIPPWKAQLKKNKEEAMKAKEKDEAKTENVPPWKRQQQQKAEESKVSSDKIVIKKDDQNVPAWKRQSKVEEKTVPSNDSNKTQTTSSSSIVKRFSKTFEDDSKKKAEIIDIKSQKRSDKFSSTPEPVAPATCSSATKKQPQKVLDMVKNFQNMQVS